MHAAISQAKQLLPHIRLVRYWRDIHTDFENGSMNAGLKSHIHTSWQCFERGEVS